MVKTTAEDYYNALIASKAEAGTLYYLMRKEGSEEEYIFESLVIDTRKKDLTVNILKRAMKHPDFIAFPGTPEMADFIKEVGEL